MLRLLTVTCVGVLLASSAVGQTLTNTSESATTLADRTPQENAGGGSVGQRAPGTWVRAALTRHSTLMGLRLNGPRFGEANTEEAELRFGSGSSAGSGTGTVGGLDALLNLANQFGGATGLGGLIGSLAGGTGTGTGTGTGGGTIPAPSNGTDYTLEDLIRLGQQFGGGQTIPTGKASTAQLQQSTVDSNAGHSWNGRAFGGAVGRLPKSQQRTQGTEVPAENELDFRTRWLNTMLGQFFSALSLGVSNSGFVAILKEALRPLFFPTSDDDDNGNENANANANSNSNANGNSNSNANNNANSNGNSNGIEDVDPNSPDNDNSAL